MIKKTIQERCNFKTQRLSISSWTKQVKELDYVKIFEETVIDILTPNVTKALPDGWQNISTSIDVQEWIKERDKESHFVTIQLVSTNEIIGFLFFNESDSKNNYYDLRFGYLLSEKIWGKGLGTEMIGGLINWCKAEGDIKSISGGVEIDNIGSIKVHEKNGFSVSTIDSPTEDVVFYEYQFDIN